MVVLICLGVGKESEKGTLSNGLSRAGFGAQDAVGFASATLLCLRIRFPTLLLPVPSITKDLKPIFFACDSFSWKADTYLSSHVLACLFLILIEFHLARVSVHYCDSTQVFWRMCNRLI